MLVYSKLLYLQGSETANNMTVYFMSDMAPSSSSVFESYHREATRKTNVEDNTHR